MTSIKDYVTARRAAVLGPLDQFIDWVASVTGSRPSAMVAEITYHTLRTAIASLPMEERRKSKEWLQLNGLPSWDDGDV